MRVSSQGKLAVPNGNNLILHIPCLAWKREKSRLVMYSNVLKSFNNKAIATNWSRSEGNDLSWFKIFN